MRGQRFKSKALNRRAGTRAVRAYTIVVCYDGERTEADYFLGWRRILGTSGVVLQPYFVDSGGNSLTAVKAAISIRGRDTDHDEFWCVCDVDDTTDAELRRAKILAAANGVKLALSTRCFEVWLALHWEKISTAPIMTERHARQLVAKHYPDFQRGPKIVPFSALLPHTKDAIRNAAWLQGQKVPNPATTVHELIQKLFARLS